MKFKLKTDTNGNRVLSVKAYDDRAFSIQTNGNLPLTHTQGINQDITCLEVIEYITKCGTDRQKQLLDIPTHEYVIIWQGEEVDTAKDKKEALYLQGEYMLAYNGYCSIKKRRIK